MIRRLIKQRGFQHRHRRDVKSFTRKRKLTFRVVLLLILQKSVKSLQLMLNEFFGKLTGWVDIVSASAFTQARQKLSHTAFIELRDKAIVGPYYQDDTFERFCGFRLLAVDGSEIVLPNTPETRSHFGSRKITNGRDNTVIDHYAFGKACVLYDVLNRMPLHARLPGCGCDEARISIEQLKQIESPPDCQDLILADRNYPSYWFLTTLMSLDIAFVCRCSRSSFKTARKMFADESTPDSQVVKLKASRDQHAILKAAALPLTITLRFVRVYLDTGEMEVLVTSLLDENTYDTEFFKKLYARRWGIETFYGTIKGRLNLENFTGKSVEAILQDFHATIFISALESLITEDAQEHLDQKQTQKNNEHPQRVNKAVSFNAIKNQVLELFYRQKDPQIILDTLTRLFLQKTISTIEKPDKTRIKSSLRKKYNFHRRKKKICY